MLTGRTVRYKQAFRTNDIVSELNLGTSAANRYAAISSILSIPIKLNEQIIGVVNLLRLDKSSPFSDSDQEMLVALASEIAEYIEQAQLREKLFSDYELLKNEIKDRYAIHGIIGRSASMSEVFAVLDRVIPTDGRVLLQGESGTGKERIARVIHYEGPRKNGPFVAVDCGALPPNLLESELFGYVRGAFTGANRDRKGLFEEANNGTLFLDEIANTTVEIQAKLLRVLQEGEIRPLGTNRARKVNVRIITAASSDLQEKLNKNEFRLDLFYRLNIVPIHIPPLRDRVEDIPLLACHFLEKYKTAHKKQLQRIMKGHRSAPGCIFAKSKLLPDIRLLKCCYSGKNLTQIFISSTKSFLPRLIWSMHRCYLEIFYRVTDCEMGTRLQLVQKKSID